MRRVGWIWKRLSDIQTIQWLLAGAMVVITLAAGVFGKLPLAVSLALTVIVVVSILVGTDVVLSWQRKRRAATTPDIRVDVHGEIAVVFMRGALLSMMRPHLVLLCLKS
jgi:hypothetical protein